MIHISPTSFVDLVNQEQFENEFEIMTKITVLAHYFKEIPRF